MKKIILFSLLLLLSSYTSICTARSTQPAPLDISKFEETFSETFRERLDVTNLHGPSRWIAHTPFRMDFSNFITPRDGAPFRTGPDGLTITARKNSKGKWETGLLSSHDIYGRGFSQSMGYFEARMKLPAGSGVWPAFWLISEEPPSIKCEIDVVEYFGVHTAQYEVNVAHWPKGKIGKEAKADANIFHKTIHVAPDSLSEAFHTYGVEIGTKDTVFYFDRLEVARTPTTEDMTYPMFLLVNLAYGSGWPIDKMPDPSILHVDYIKVFKRTTP